MNLITLDQFIAKYTNQRVRSARGLGGECVDLVEQYLAEVLNYETPGGLPGNAIDFFGEDPGNFTSVRNDPNDLNQIPPRGAIMVWGPSPAVGTGPFGHVDVIVAASSLSFDGFDQNWPVGAAAHLVHHSYAGVIGWMYPRIWDPKPVPAPVPAPAPTPAPVPPAPVNPPIVSPPPVVLDPMFIFSFQVTPDDPLRPLAGAMTFQSALSAARGYLADHPGAVVDVVTEVS